MQINLVKEVGKKKRKNTRGSKTGTTQRQAARTLGRKDILFLPLGDLSSLLHSKQLSLSDAARIPEKISLYFKLVSVLKKIPQKKCYKRKMKKNERNSTVAFVQ